MLSTSRKRLIAGLASTSLVLMAGSGIAMAVSPTPTPHVTSTVVADAGLGSSAGMVDNTQQDSTAEGPDVSSSTAAMSEQESATDGDNLQSTSGAGQTDATAESNSEAASEAAVADGPNQGPDANPTEPGHQDAGVNG